MERNRDELVEVLSDFADYLDQRIVRPAVADLSAAAAQIDRQKQKSRAEFLGEYIRESAVLVLVFIPIDLLIPRLLDPQKPLPHSWLWFSGTLAVSLGLLLLGIKVERS